MRQEVICILGMHRSGTSLVARIAREMGVYLGEDAHLLSPSFDNPDGFFENKYIYTAHEKILNALGFQWDSTVPLPKNWLFLETIQPHLAELKELISDKFQDRPMWGWKDPRGCILFPIWEKLLDKKQVDLKLIIPFRNPLDVANSLTSRNGFRTTHGVRLWYYYMTNVWPFTTQYPCLFVDYDQLIENPRKSIKAIRDFISPTKTITIGKNIFGFIKTNMRHSKSELSDLELYGQRVLRLYQACKQAAITLSPGAGEQGANRIQEYKEYARLIEANISDDKSRSSSLISSIYYSTDGFYSEENSVKRNIHQNGDGRVDLEFEIHKTIFASEITIRWDPLEGVFCRCKIEEILVDEKKVTWKSIGAWRTVNRYDEFVTKDPVYQISERFNNVKKVSIQAYIEIVPEDVVFDWLSLDRDRKLLERDQQILERDKQVLKKEQSLQEYIDWIANRDQLIAQLKTQVQEYVDWVANRDQLINQLTAQLAEITNSRSWKFILFLRRLRILLLPNRFSFKEFMRRLLIIATVWSSRQPAFTRLIKHVIPLKIRAKINRAAQPGEPISNNPVDAEKYVQATLTDWEAYLHSSERIFSLNRTRLTNFVPKQPSLVSFNDKDLIGVAKSLKLVRYEHPDISIIIPVHNNAKLTLECLATIADNTNEISYEIIIIDDNSDSEIVEILESISCVSLIHNDNRIGFTVSCNRGAGAARGKFLLFLNNDTQVMKGWLKHLLEIFVKQDEVGAVGPKVLYPDGRLQEAGGVINRDGTIIMVGLADNPDLSRYNFTREVDYCSGVCLMIDANAFRIVGGFDELYSPAYYEDVDLCLKLRANGMKIIYCPDSTIVHHLSATTNEIDSNFKNTLVARNRQNFLEKWYDALDELNQVKLIAFYLPQYHPIPENDLWWGKGFTEWTNVTRARPNYDGHYQPHLPADLGFYDLRVSEVMEQQIELAKRYNIYGFCYYYYWFNGKRLLDMPLERMLTTGSPNFPFCLCWANENWSRRWDGSEDNVLIAQNHSDEDDLAVIRDIARYMVHPSYIRVNGKPILLLYRISLFPDIKRTTGIWRKFCIENGIGEIHLVMVKSFETTMELIEPSDYGVDATVEFPPHNFMRSNLTPTNILNQKFTGIVGDYSENIIRYMSERNFTPIPNNYLTVFPRWDNTPRRQNNPFIFEGSNPGVYQAWLEACIEITRCFHFGDEKLVFINAWNEWAEGNHLEPDQKFGHRYLEATRNAVEKWLLR